MASRRIAVMIEQYYTIAHHTQVYRGIQRHAVDTGRWQIVLDPFADHLLARDAQAYDGVIARANRGLCQQAQKSGVPVVNVWFNSPVMEQLPGVFPNYVEVGRLAAEHLMARGLRRFGMLRNFSERIPRLLLQGFRGALQSRASTVPSARSITTSSSKPSRGSKTVKR